MGPESVSVVIAFGAGLLSFVSPCVLPLVPVYLAHLAGAAATTPEASPARRTAFLHALLFVLGFSLVFIALGASMGLVGSLVRGYLPLLRKISGVILILLGLHLVGLFKIPLLHRERRLNYNPRPAPGYLRSFLIGSAFAIGWTPCVGPILGAILTLAWSSATVGQGASLLAVYSAGLGVPFLLAGLALSTATGYLKHLNRHLNIVSIASGVLLIGIGILIFTNSLLRLNSYFDFFNLGAGI